jgi:hypothetical protein
MKTEKTTARVFADVGGYYFCDEELEYLDARGTAYPSKAAALRAAYGAGYTHAVGSGAYKQGRGILSQVSVSHWERDSHISAVWDREREQEREQEREREREREREQMD